MSEQKEKPKRILEKAEAIEVVKPTKELRRRKRKRIYFHYLTNIDAKPPEKRSEFPEHLINKTFELGKFYSELIFEEIAVAKGRWVHRSWYYRPEDFRCTTCEKSSEILFNIQPTGVYKRCDWCKTTQGPEAPVDTLKNVEKAILLVDEVISRPRAEKIIARTGQRAPWLRRKTARPTKKRTRKRRVY